MLGTEPVRFRPPWSVAAIAVAICAAGGTAAADTDTQVWTASGATAAVSPGERGVSAWFDAHLRRSDGGIVHIARPGLGYRVNRDLSVWLGYAWVPVVPDQGDTLHEHRIWQQAIYKLAAGGVSLQSRTRFEQRFGDGGDDVGLRLRQFVRAGRAIGDSPFGLVAWDEVFIGLNDTDWGAPRGFDQNRLFVGGWAAVAPHLRVELGYLFLYVDRDDDTVGHVLATNVFVSL